MSLPGLAKRASLLPKTPLSSFQTQQRFASAKKKGAKGKLDPRLDNIRRALYPATRKDKTENPAAVLRKDFREALARVIPSNPEVHETIEAAWQLHQRSIRNRREEELGRKMACMRAAMDELQNNYPALYKEARKRVDPRSYTPEEEALYKQYRGLSRKALESRQENMFPREMRIPVDTPGRDGWNYDWAPPPKFVLPTPTS